MVNKLAVIAIVGLSIAGCSKQEDGTSNPVVLKCTQWNDEEKISDPNIYFNGIERDVDSFTVVRIKGFHVEKQISWGYANSILNIDSDYINSENRLMKSTLYDINLDTLEYSVLDTVFGVHPNRIKYGKGQCEFYKKPDTNKI